VAVGKGLAMGLVGWKPTEETRRKMSEAHKGVKRPYFTDEWRKKISEALRGKKKPPRGPMSAEERKKHSDANKGKMTGPQHHHWKGGITGENKRLRCSAAFREWREAVFVRDNWTCAFCGQRGRKLHPDHIKPFAEYPELRFDVSNGRTLCIPCHMKTDTWGANKRYYK